MFATPITSSPMINTIANEMFGNITCGSFRGDCSMLTTLRALFYKRVGDDKLTSNITCSPFNTDGNDKEIVDHLSSRLYSSPGNSSNMLQIHSITMTAEQNEAAVAALKEEFCKKYSGYKENELIRVMYKKAFPVICFQNEDVKSVVLFVGGLTLRKLHWIEASLLLMFPWYFDKEKSPVTPFELELCNSLQKNSEDEYVACIKRFADQFDFRSEKIKAMLKGFETKFEKIKLDNCKTQVSQYDRQIEDLVNRIESSMVARNDLFTKILGLEAKIASGDHGESEIMDYFLCNKRLGVVDVSDDCLTFFVTDYLTYFDKESAEASLRNQRSSFYSYEGLDKLLKAVLIDEKLRIRFCAQFTMHLNGSVHADIGINYAELGVTDCIPNPHLNHYHCLGNNERVIVQMMREHDYIGAIEQCVAACKNWNILDSAVTGSFVRDLHSLTTPCVELPDGSVVTVSKAIEWLNSNGDADEQEQKEEE